MEMLGLINFSEDLVPWSGGFSFPPSPFSTPSTNRGRSDGEGVSLRTTPSHPLPRNNTCTYILHQRNITLQGGLCRYRHSSQSGKGWHGSIIPTISSLSFRPYFLTRDDIAWRTGNGIGRHMHGSTPF